MGWKKAKLIQELAQGDKLQSQLAREYGVTQGRISQFRKKHEADIDRVREDLLNEFAALWIVDKVNRLAEYEADVEQLNTRPFDVQLLAAKHRALKQVAEELGHLPNRVTLQGEVTTKVHYLVDGVDDETLK